MDVAKTKAAEGELDNFTCRRHEKRLKEGERPAEEMWAESERRYTQQRREENRAAWCEYHEDQAARMRAVLEALIGYHNVQAQKYRENGHHQEEDSCSSRSTPKSR